MRLESSFYNIREEIYKKLKKDLKAPFFAIKENLTRAETCGTWSKSDRIISLKRSFIKNYELNLNLIRYCHIYAKHFGQFYHIYFKFILIIFKHFL